jgi:hypothetical protein
MRNRGIADVEGLDVFLNTVPEADREAVRVYTSLGRGLLAPPPSGGLELFNFYIKRLWATYTTMQLRSQNVSEVLREFSKVGKVVKVPLKLAKRKKPTWTPIESKVINVETKVLVIDYILATIARIEELEKHHREEVQKLFSEKEHTHTQGSA